MANPLMWYSALGGAVILFVVLLFVAWRSGRQSDRQLHLDIVQRMQDVAVLLQGKGVLTMFQKLR